MMTVGEISTTRPLAIKVFQRHGIQFCCSGGTTLAEACAARGVDPTSLLQEIAVEEARSATTERRWDEAPTSELIDHLQVQYHAPMREDLTRIEVMAARVVQVHGHKDDDLALLLDVVIALRNDLEPHLTRQEQVLFPQILRGDGAAASALIATMRHEHDQVAILLARARELTHDYQIPAGACRTWSAVWAGLETLDRELGEHIALENNVLFPRALSALRS